MKVTHEARRLHSCPTRRSSDLLGDRVEHRAIVRRLDERIAGFAMRGEDVPKAEALLLERDHRVGVRDDNGGRLDRSRSQVDRQSTRLNSSHMSISYAVFFLKKQ